MKRGETVILAAGDFPRKGGVAWDLLASAKRVEELFAVLDVMKGVK